MGRCCETFPDWTTSAPAATIGAVTIERLRDRQWLAEQLATRSQRELAADLGCHTNTVNRAVIRLFGADSSRRRRSKFPELNDREWLVERLDRPVKQVARELGCDPHTVRAALERHGLR